VLFNMTVCLSVSSIFTFKDNVNYFVPRIKISNVVIISTASSLKANTFEFRHDIGCNGRFFVPFASF
jgi:hypothetical protein